MASEEESYIYAFKTLISKHDKIIRCLKIGHHTGPIENLRSRYITAYPNFDTVIVMFVQCYEAKEFENYIKKLWNDRRFECGFLSEHYIGVSKADIMNEIIKWEESHQKIESGVVAADEDLRDFAEILYSKTPTDDAAEIYETYENFCSKRGRKISHISHLIRAIVSQNTKGLSTESQRCYIDLVSNNLAKLEHQIYLRKQKIHLAQFLSRTDI